MGILKKALQLFSSNFRDIMVQHGSRDLFLRQALRKKANELKQQEALLQKMAAARKRIQQEHEQCSRGCDELEEELSLAADKHQTRIIINQLNPLLNHRDDLGHHIQSLEREIKGFEDSMQNQRHQYEQLKIKVRQYFYQAEPKRRDRIVSGSIQHHEASPVSPTR
jgi:phage shock protein A